MNNSSHIIQLENVSMLYGSKVALENINISFERGLVYGLVGRNGAGKSTLIKLLQGEEQATLGNMNVTENLKIGHVSHDDHFPANFSIKDIDDLFSHSNQEWLAGRFWHLITEFKLNKKAKYGALSTGEKAGVRLATLFARKLDVWLLDEATQGIDVIAQDIVIKAFLEYFEEDNPCCIFCSHNLDEIERLTDRLLIQKNAQMVWQGQTQELCHPTQSFSESLTEIFSGLGIEGQGVAL